jgi:hydroxymethylpyrimidine/phosphomethylpyrimidine kinase
VRAWEGVPARLVSAQIGAVLQPLAVAAVKTGLLPTPAVIRAVASALAARPQAPLVVDPVLGSTSGTRFLFPPGIRALRRELLPRAALVTPNWPEAEALAQRPVRTDRQARDAARQLADECGCAVLVKGGHGHGTACRDWLATPDGKLVAFSSTRIATRNTHGTGCVLSAAIAAHLARGEAVPAAVAHARTFLRRALRRGRKVDWGTGAGPAYANAGMAASTGAGADPRANRWTNSRPGPTTPRAPGSSRTNGTDSG